MALAGNQKRSQRRRQTEGQHHVGQNDARLEYEAGRGGQDRGCEQCSTAIIQDSGDQIRDQRRHQTAQGRGESSGKLVQPEELH